MYLVRSIVNMSVVLALVGRNFDDKKIFGRQSGTRRVLSFNM